MPRLAANLTLLFNEVAFPDRFQAAADAGFKAVEFLFPYEWPAGDIKACLDEAGLELVLFNSPPGDWEAGDRGSACDPRRMAEFRKSILLALDYAKILQPRCLHIMTGLTPVDVSKEQARECLLTNLAWATDLCSKEGVRALIEPLNLQDNPGYFLSDFGDAMALIEETKARGAIAPMLQFDIYHCAKIHGDVLDWLKRTAGEIGHFQIADPFKRQEPNPENLPLGQIFQTIDQLAEGTFLGCEYFPKESTQAGLVWTKSQPLISF